MILVVFLRDRFKILALEHQHHVPKLPNATAITMNSILSVSMTTTTRFVLVCFRIYHEVRISVCPEASPRDANGVDSYVSMFPKLSLSTWSLWPIPLTLLRCSPQYPTPNPDDTRVFIMHCSRSGLHRGDGTFDLKVDQKTSMIRFIFLRFKYAAISYTFCVCVFV